MEVKNLVKTAVALGETKKRTRIAINQKNALSLQSEALVQEAEHFLKDEGSQKLLTKIRTLHHEVIAHYELLLEEAYKKLKESDALITSIVKLYKKRQL